MIEFFAAGFAVAGLAAAVAPVLIHLLNRRRFRVVEWAAMEFLREALQRKRRYLQLRDLLLLMFRILCMLLFGLALAQPYFTDLSQETLFRTIGISAAILVTLAALVWTVLATTHRTRFPALLVMFTAAGLAAWGLFDAVQEHSTWASGTPIGRQPIHAVLIFDNSLSMGYESLDGNLLDLARRKALEFLDRLPPESRVTIVPLCGSPADLGFEPYRSREDARAAIQRIAVVDQSASAAQAVDLAVQACQHAPELAEKRVVFFSDMQAHSWPAASLESMLNSLPELQLVNLAAESPENIWVTDFQVQDGIADVETPARFLATVGYLGTRPVSNVQVTLTIDGIDADSRLIDLEPGQFRQLEFLVPIDVEVEPGRPTFVPAVVSVQPPSLDGDRLATDNQRVLTLPVVSGLPVVFVDQFGSEENLARSRIGETYPLRRLLAPRSRRDGRDSSWIEVRHTTVDQLDREVVKDARLVVVAGVADPEPAVSLLCEYVLQGGRLLIAAGAEFDPAAWTAHAWNDGVGILPVPLKGEPVGALPQNSPEDVRLFHLDFDSLQHDVFQIPGESREALQDLYRLPLFFRAVQADFDEAHIETLLAAETERIERQSQRDDQNREEANWLHWRVESFDEPGSASPRRRAERNRPRVLATFTENGLPFLVERNLGQGRVLMMTTGISANWNTLSTTNAILIFDRLLRGMLEETLPRRNFRTGEPIRLPVEATQQLQYALQRPDGEEEPLAVEALGPETFGLSIRDAVHRGHYQILARRLDPGSATAVGETAREIPIAVNGPERESELRSLARDEFERRIGAARVRWLERDEPISLESARTRGRDLWKLLIKLALAGLGLEMLVLAWSHRTREPLA